MCELELDEVQAQLTSIKEAVEEQGEAVCTIREQLGELPDLGELSAQMQDLTETIQEHRDEVRAVRDAVDELRDLIEWLSRNPEPPAWSADRVCQLHSMPLDPTARDFGERINSVSTEKIAELRDEVATPPQRGEAGAADQRRLF